MAATKEEAHGRARRMVGAVGVREARVARAMAEVPRHEFVDERFRSLAYEDTPLPIGPEATISAPHMVALQLEAADLRPGHRVLELGSGSGYLLALASRLVTPGGSVVGFEIEPELVDRSRANLRRTSCPTEVEVRLADSPGPSLLAPFDRLLVSYAQPTPLPPQWLDLVRPGGLAVVPWERSGVTELCTLSRSAEGWGTVRRGPACVFVGAKARARGRLAGS